MAIWCKKPKAVEDKMAPEICGKRNAKVVVKSCLRGC